jgi:hypothetical protein
MDFYFETPVISDTANIHQVQFHQLSSNGLPTTGLF